MLGLQPGVRLRRCTCPPCGAALVHNIVRISSTLLLLSLIVGCAEGVRTGGRVGIDAGPTSDDAGFHFADAGRTDSGTITLMDSGTPTADAGPGDAGVMTDGGPVGMDAGPVDAGFDAGAPTVSPACMAALAAANYDFESGAGEWVTFADDDQGSGWAFDQWEFGNATHGGGCADGTGCVATILDDNYIQCGRAYLGSPTMDLSACAGEELVLRFDHRYDFMVFDDEFGDPYFDGGLVRVNFDGEWFLLNESAYPGTIDINPSLNGYQCTDRYNFYVDDRPGYVGSSGGWQTVTLTIPMNTADVLIGFRWASGVSWETTSMSTSQRHTTSGWAIDNVRVELASGAL